MRRERQKGLVYSVAFHLLLLLLMIFGLPSLLKNEPPPEPAAITVELLPMSNVSNVKPIDGAQAEKPKPEEPKKEPEQKKPAPPVKTAEATPPPPKPEPAPTPKPAEIKKPEPKKEEKKEPPKPKQEDLEAVLKAVKDTAQKEKTDKKPEDKKTTATANKAISNHYDASLPMSLSEKDAIMSQLAKCWHPLDGAKNAKNLVVVIDAEFNADGSYIKENIANESLGRYNSDSFFRSAADAALRAVRECSPLKNLPAEKYETWKIMELHFDPKELF